MSSVETTVLAGDVPPIPSSDPGSERGASGRSQLQDRLALYAKVLNLVYLAYWPGFLMTWGNEPNVGFDRALGHVLAPGTFVLGAIQLAFWLVVRARVRSGRELRVIDLGAHALIGTAFAVIVATHPSPSIAVFEGVLALTCVLACRALLVPSSWARSAITGVIAAIPIVLGLLIRGPHVAGGIVTARTECLLFVNWAVIAIAISSVASGVLYGLRRQVRVARRLGQYTLGEKLGEGGMGVVFRAQHAMLKRPTAIKLLSKASPADSARFEQEAQLTSQLTHPSAVVVHDYGRTADGVLYYAMEYLEGLDLEQLGELDGPQHPGRVIHILRQVCGALVEAHGNGLIHRDIKPANLFLCQRSHDPDFVKVLDFGLVKDLGPRATLGLTGTGMVGTPLYMSPESVSDPTGLDARSDLYAIGATAYRLLTGSTVFEGENAVEVWGHTLHTAPQTPSARLGEPVPADLEAIVMRCLAKSPADRFATAGELIAALDACADARTWTTAHARAWWRTRAERIGRSREEKHRANTVVRAERRVAAATRGRPGRISGLAGASA
jgi:hypothetical protein